MVRKATGTATTEATPRRSTRISAKPPPVQAAASGKKRSADEADAETSLKKAKPAEGGAVGDAAPSGKEGPGPEEENTAVVGKIDIGDTLPSSITLKNEKGEDVNVGDLTAQRGVVLFLVPKADTPGCTTQACGFRDSFPDYTSLDFDVYCLSADAPSAQAKWQGKKNLPYSLLSDPKRTLIGALGAADGNKTKRSHFIFEKGGKLVDKKMPVKPVDSPKLALEFIKSLARS